MSFNILDPSPKQPSPPNIGHLQRGIHNLICHLLTLSLSVGKYNYLPGTEACYKVLNTIIWHYLY